MNTAVQTRSTTQEQEVKVNKNLPKAEYLIKLHEAADWKYTEYPDTQRQLWAKHHGDYAPDWPAQTFALPFDDNRELIVQFAPDANWDRNASDMDLSVNSSTNFSAIADRPSSFDADYKSFCLLRDVKFLLMRN